MHLGEHGPGVGPGQQCFLLSAEAGGTAAADHGFQRSQEGGILTTRRVQHGGQPALRYRSQAAGFPKDHQFHPRLTFGR